jgi:hypothetical protein
MKKWNKSIRRNVKNEERNKKEKYIYNLNLKRKSLNNNKSKNLIIFFI